MKSNHTSNTSARLKFAGLYLLSIVLMLFILFPFLKGNSTTVATHPVRNAPETRTVEVVKTDSSEIKKLSEEAQKSLLQYQADLKQRDDRILELENKVQQLQQTATSNTPVKTQPSSSAEVESLKTRLAALEKKNATLIELNNDLKKNNEYLTAQLASKGK